MRFLCSVRVAIPSCGCRTCADMPSSSCWITCRANGTAQFTSFMTPFLSWGYFLPLRFFWMHLKSSYALQVSVRRYHAKPCELSILLPPHFPRKNAIQQHDWIICILYSVGSLGFPHGDCLWESVVCDCYKYMQWYTTRKLWETFYWLPPSEISVVSWCHCT